MTGCKRFSEGENSPCEVRCRYDILHDPHCGKTKAIERPPIENKGCHRNDTSQDQQDIDILRTHKPMSLWQGLIHACQEVNAVSSETVEEEKD